jgi:hypothetical protein
VVSSIHVLGGGTFAHVRAHLALSAPAFGSTARRIADLISRQLIEEGKDTEEVTLHLTRMAHPENTFAPVTNQHVATLVDRLVADPETRIIYLNVALCDYDGAVGETPSGKYAERLKTSEGEQTVVLTPSDKIISRIRRDRKDIFLVAFKTTAGATPDEQYVAGLNLLKANSANLVLANDLITRNNMVIAPEETRYHETTDRDAALRGLIEMTNSRSTNHFTRSTVVEGQPVDFQNDPRVPANLREVVNHLVARGAYKPFRQKTVGHFAARLRDGACLTSRRKVNFNDTNGLDLVEVGYEGTDRVIAHGAKPSVGGQSQRVIFSNHPDIDCIAHAHVEMRPDARDRDKIALDSGQWRRECGSTECGQSVSDLLPQTKGVRAVMIENHGPNIVFSRDTPAEEVINFIDANFDLGKKTGGGVFA